MSLASPLAVRRKAYGGFMSDCRIIWCREVASEIRTINAILFRIVLLGKLLDKYSRKSTSEQVESWENFKRVENHRKRIEAAHR